MRRGGYRLFGCGDGLITLGHKHRHRRIGRGKRLVRLGLSETRGLRRRPSGRHLIAEAFRRTPLRRRPRRGDGVPDGGSELVAKHRRLGRESGCRLSSMMYANARELIGARIIAVEALAGSCLRGACWMVRKPRRSRAAVSTGLPTLHDGSPFPRDPAARGARRGGPIMRDVTGRASLPVFPGPRIWFAVRQSGDTRVSDRRPSRSRPYANARVDFFHAATSDRRDTSWLCNLRRTDESEHGSATASNASCGPLGARRPADSRKHRKMSSLLIPGINCPEPCNTFRETSKTCFRRGNADSATRNTVVESRLNESADDARHNTKPIRYFAGQSRAENGRQTSLRHPLVHNVSRL